MAGAMMNYIFPWEWRSAMDPFQVVYIFVIMMPKYPCGIHRSFPGGIDPLPVGKMKLELLFHDPKRLSIGEEMIQVWGEMILF